MRKMLKWFAGGFVLLVVIAAVAGGQSEDSPSTEGEKGSADSGKQEEKACGSVASDDCTPRVGASKSVRVDALRWKLTGATAVKTVGDPQLLGETANGVFVVADISVTSKKDESVTLTSSAVQLEVSGTTYDVDTDGSIAVAGTGEESFIAEDIGPDSTVSGKVVFDVPAAKVGRTMYLRFNELGFGQSHGFIRVPTLTAP